MTKFAFAHNSTLAKSEPSWGGIDKSALPRIAFARKGEAEHKSTWGFPHHWVKGGNTKNADGVYTDGTLYLHKGGLNAAWSAAHGGRSGKPAEPAVIAHLRKHFADIGITKAELQALDTSVDLDNLDQLLIQHGYLTADDLEFNATRRIKRFLSDLEE